MLKQNTLSLYRMPHNLGTHATRCKINDKKVTQIHNATVSMLNNELDLSQRFCCTNYYQNSLCSLPTGTSCIINNVQRRGTYLINVCHQNITHYNAL
jgi:hypothetical protein